MDRLLGFQEVDASRIARELAHEAVRMSALITGLLYPRRYTWYSFLVGAESHHGHSAARSIKSMKNPDDNFRIRTCNLPACSAVPQPTASQRFSGNLSAIENQLHL
jgi:hypothetical protein